MVFTRKSGQSGPEPAVSQPPLPPSRAATPPAPPPTPPLPPRQTVQATQAVVPSESVIGADLTIEGQSITMRCKGALRVNGTIQAEVHSLQLVIGEQASVTGAVVAETVNVHGRVTGAILGARVTLHPTAVVEGDIHSQALSIEQGASFDGRSRKVNDAREIAPQINPPSQAHSGAPPAPSAHALPQGGGEESAEIPLPRVYS